MKIQKKSAACMEIREVTGSKKQYLSLLPADAPLH